MLNPEQTDQIKKQLIQQIEKSFPDDKKDFAKQQIEAMDSEQLETFLKQNKLITTQEPGQPTGCVFCSIVSGEVDSHKIDENAKAIVVLEINPVSKGHVLVIPKEHLSSSDKVPAGVFSLAKKVAKRIKTKLKPKNVTISSSNLFGHEIINVIPAYGDDAPTERQTAKPKELLKLNEILAKTEKPKTIKPQKKTKLKKEKPGEKLWLPKRIP